jgi:DNA polymerase elongation subunit (family B)
MVAFYTNVFVHRNEIRYRGYKDGERIQLKHNYKPYLFIDSENGTYRTIDGKPVAKKSFSCIKEAREFVSRYEEIQGFNIYGLSNYDYAFIRDLFPVREIKFDSSLIRTGYLDIEVAADDGFPNIEIADKPITAITIKAGKTIYTFGCGDFKEDRTAIHYQKCANESDLIKRFLKLWETLDLDIVTGWNIRFFDIPYIVHRIIRLSEEEDVADPWARDEEKRLSPWKNIYRKDIEVRGKTNVSYDIQGVAVLDYMELYKKFTFKNHESYRLDAIAEAELNEGKLDYSEYGSLLELYRNNYQKFIQYNIRDVEIIESLEEKLGFIELVQELAYDAKCNYNDVLTTIRPWDIIIHNYLLEKGIVIPFIKKHNLDHAIPGGFVKEPKKGMSNWVVSFDLTSLYPHLIMGYNISADTYLGQIKGLPTVSMVLQETTDDAVYKWEVPQAYHLKDGNIHPQYDTEVLGAHRECTVTANGCKYRTDFQGFMPALMEMRFKTRAKYKKEMIKWKKELKKLEHDCASEEKILNAKKEVSRFKNKQKAKKIQLNSLYGALLNIWMRWFSYNNGEAITTTGQLVIKFVDMVLNEFLNEFFHTEGVDYIIASDTDSVYICMEKFFDGVPWNHSQEEACAALDNFCDSVIQPFLEKKFKEFSSVTRAYQEKLFMKRETICTKGLWRAKKMYILNVINDEGVQHETPKLTMHGIEAVRSSTPQACRKAIKNGLSIIMNKTEDDLIDYVKDFRKAFDKMPFEAIALPRSVNKIGEYSCSEHQNEGKPYRKSTPIQVKSSILYNQLLKKYGLRNLEPIKNGDKIRFCYLKKPNPLKDGVIASPGPLPVEFGLEKYLDRETQFEKTFLAPIKSLADVIGWNVDTQGRLF